MIRLSLLGVLAIGATLIAAPAASAKPIGLVHIGGAQAHHVTGHAPKSRCAHNGSSTNKAGHLNCRRQPAQTTTGDPAPVAAPSSGTGDPTDTPPTTSSGSDQGYENDQGDDNQGDDNNQGDQSGSDDQGSSSGDDQQ